MPLRPCSGPGSVWGLREQMTADQGLKEQKPTPSQFCGQVPESRLAPSGAVGTVFSTPPSGSWCRPALCGLWLCHFGLGLPWVCVQITHSFSYRDSSCGA